MRSFANVANLITSANLAAGFVALLLAADGRLREAALAVAVAAVLDSVDGLVARRLSLSDRFGSQLDSLADLVAFGVAPALMLERGVLHAVPIVGTGACLAFLLAGAWRLARFPLVADRHYFVGLPIPPAGLLAAAVAALALPAPVVLALTLALALLMVSSIPFPTLLTVRSLTRLRPPLATALRSARQTPAAADGRAAGGRMTWRSRARRGAGWPTRAARPRRRRVRP